MYTARFQVVIGGEGRWEELKDCSIILSRYGVMDEFSGTVAVIGPTRMSYGRNVAAVRYVADLMSGFVYEYYAEDTPGNNVQENRPTAGKSSSNTRQENEVTE